MCWKTVEKFSKYSGKANEQEERLRVNTNVSNAGFKFLNKINFANVYREVMTFLRPQGHTVFGQMCSTIQNYNYRDQQHLLFQLLWHSS